MPKTEPKTKPITITQKLQHLEAAVEWFASEDFNLDEALAKYRAANDLAGEIEQDLGELKNQVEVIADYAAE